MATTKLILTTDIKEIKPISDNIDSVERINPYIIEAQDLDIRPFLGDPLFYALVEGFTASPQNTDYLALLNGKSYTTSCGFTIFFDGLKIAIAYFAYARFVSSQGINITRFGVVQKTNEFSQPVTVEMVDRIAGNARSVGLSYLHQVEEFLDENTTTYPLWRQSDKKRPRGKFKITSVKNY